MYCTYRLKRQREKTKTQNDWTVQSRWRQSDVKTKDYERSNQRYLTRQVHSRVDNLLTNFVHRLVRPHARRVMSRKCARLLHTQTHYNICKSSYARTHHTHRNTSTTLAHMSLTPTSFSNSAYWAFKSKYIKSKTRCRVLFTWAHDVQYSCCYWR